VRCGACGTENEAGRKFCLECGSPLALICPACRAPNTPGAKFCGECGSALTGVEAPAPAAAPAAERRLVSVLFADLVGFTTLSESRDSEEVRELLSAYFDRCKRLIERYGGTVEKFIGDAVMAVWGTPVAMEDDAERAVRAALELVAAVAEIDPSLSARAGVLTGEAAVTLGAEGQGMVAGDLVNTAARVQSDAEPGTVLVGEATKRATEAAIAYEDAGTHDLKGKTEPMQLFRALRVIAGRAGALRSGILEPPFVGRDRELRLVKEMFHASADERRAQLVSVVGVAGVGKTRLSWEFEKYVDGLADEAWWHRGRCLSYGEGVAYWALAEMVRMRCGITEDEDAASARAKLRATLEQHVPDSEERSWVEPRLAHLLGLEEGVSGDQENLFSAWRVLFERLAEIDPVLLVFEDMQWADEGLVAFLDYLLDWSRSHPIFVLSLARPELADKHPSWGGGGRRAVTSLYLEPLPRPAMESLLAGLVPGLPEELRNQILERAEGIPLYAVETVRMLLDRGLLAHDGTAFQPTGPIETLEVPETLHALVAARLDGLSPEERRLVQGASVLGKTFTKPGIGAVTGLPEDEVDPLLASLVRKEVLAIQADPRSPERGQYSFLQDIVKHVGYETLSKRERKEKHLAAARYLEHLWGPEEDEIVEVVAAHYLDAWRQAPDADDAEELKRTACDMLIRAAERASSLGANAEAQGAYERAIELTDDAVVQAELEERAGVEAVAGARADAAIRHFEDAIARFEGAALVHPAARVSARLAEVMWERGRLVEAVESLERSFEVLSQDEPDEALAALAAQLGRFMFFAGEYDVASARIETALALAEALLLPEVFSQALNTKAIMLTSRNRRQEAAVLVRHALEVALEASKPSAAMRAYNNVGDILAQGDRFEEAEQVLSEGLAYARKLGNRQWERALSSQIYPLFSLGKWDVALERTALVADETLAVARLGLAATLYSVVLIHIYRGELDQAERALAHVAELESSADVQEREAYRAAQAMVLLAKGEAAQALKLAEERVAARGGDFLGLGAENMKELFVVALAAAFELNDAVAVERILGILDQLPPGHSSQVLQAQASRFRARLCAEREETDEADRLFKRAAGLFRELAMPFYLAAVQLEHAEWLAGQGRGGEAEALLAEAREVFERLRTTPWLERCDAVLVPVARIAAGTD
jgi:class 3 adenylate cyclase/tetratricopeptide (TPR) repeat protein